MKTKLTAMLLCAVLLLAACSAPPAATTTPTTTAPPETTVPVETTAPAELTRYPLNADSTYVNLAQQLPAHIFTTTGTENGLWGRVYSFEGSVLEHQSFDSDGFIFEIIVVDVDGHPVMITNYYKAMYNMMVSELGAAVANSQMPYDVKDYCFANDGETAKFLCIYDGYSGTAEMPMFILGANPILFELLEYPDPAAKENNQSTGETKSDAEQGTKENPYMEGTYKVGTDVPAGEYLFVITDPSGGYVCVSADSNKDDIIENEMVELCWFATVKDGQYLEVRDCAFLHAENATLNINEDGSFVAGMYRVGIDIPAGEYKLTTDDMGYWCIYKDSVVPFDIVSNDLFEGSTYVTVKDGQYLITSDCIAVPVE